MSGIDKYTRAPVKSDDIRTADNHLVGVVWEVPGSKEGVVYDVEMVQKGFTCTCPSFSYRGKCKHINGIIERICSEEYHEYR